MSLARLSGYCQAGRIDLVQKLLVETERTGEIIDIMACNGGLLYFRFKENQHQLIKILLEYYEKHFITNADPASASKATESLTKKIDDITENHEMSKEMREALAHYLDEDICRTTASLSFEREDEDGEVSGDLDSTEADNEIPLNEIFSAEVMGTLGDAHTSSTS